MDPPGADQRVMPYASDRNHGLEVNLATRTERRTRLIGQALEPFRHPALQGGMDCGPADPEVRRDTLGVPPLSMEANDGNAAGNGIRNIVKGRIAALHNVRGRVREYALDRLDARLPSMPHTAQNRYWQFRGGAAEDVRPSMPRSLRA